MKSIVTQKMSDKSVLEELIKYYSLTHYQNSVALVGVTEKFIVHYVSEPFIKKLELVRSPEEILGYPTLELIRFVRSQEAVDKASSILNKVLENNTQYETIAINSNRQLENIILKYKLAPLHNKCTGNIIAIEISVSSYMPFSLMYSQGKLHASNNSHQQVKKPINLSTRESEVLFLNCYCKSAKEVAAILSKRYNKEISLHSINTINRRLYIKFDVYSLEALIELGFKYGYHMKIPTSLLEEGNVINLGL